MKPRSGSVSAATLVLAVVALSFAVGARGAECEVLDLSNPNAPQLVREYLELHGDPYVRLCGGNLGRPEYLAAFSEVSKDHTVCRYLEQKLEISSAGTQGKQRLVRARGDAGVYMLASESACPSPKEVPYVQTLDVSAETFEKLVGMWLELTSSVEFFDRTVPPASDPLAVAQLRRLVADGRARHLRVVRVFVAMDGWLRRKYSVDIAHPEQTDEFFAMRVSRWFGVMDRIEFVGIGVY